MFAIKLGLLILLFAQILFILADFQTLPLSYSGFPVFLAPLQT